MANVNPRARAKPAAPAAASKVAKPAKAAKPAAPQKVKLSDLRDTICENLPLVSKPTVDRILQETFKVITDEFGKGNIVEIKDFGKLMIQDRAARTGRNPATGEEITIAAKRVPKFVFSKGLKELVN